MATKRARSVEGEAVALAVEAAASDGFIAYDVLKGPGLDTALWSPALVAAANRRGVPDTRGGRLGRGRPDHLIHVTFLVRDVSTK